MRSTGNARALHSIVRFRTVDMEYQHAAAVWKMACTFDS
jgi:hypothetical protein